MSCFLFLIYILAKKLFIQFKNSVTLLFKYIGHHFHFCLRFLPKTIYFMDKYETTRRNFADGAALAHNRIPSFRIFFYFTRIS